MGALCKKENRWRIDLAPGAKREVPIKFSVGIRPTSM